jgi:hypothetical protein
MDILIAKYVQVLSLSQSNAPSVNFAFANIALTNGQREIAHALSVAHNLLEPNCIGNFRTN